MVADEGIRQKESKYLLGVQLTKNFEEAFSFRIVDKTF